MKIPIAPRLWLLSVQSQRLDAPVESILDGGDKKTDTGRLNGHGHGVVDSAVRVEHVCSALNDRRGEEGARRGPWR